MRFEGTVTINAPRTRVWAMLIDSAVFQRLAPTIVTVQELEPQRRFVLEVGLPFRAEGVTISAEVIWESVVANEQLLWLVRLPYSNQKIKSSGEMCLTGLDQCQIEFWSEISELPKSLPAPLVHNIATKGIRTFFSNLKTEAEG